MESEFNPKDVIAMKLLHYFITEQNYNPVVLHGAKNEIWLENMNSNYKIVRIVSNYIHNDEQLDVDIYKTKRIVKNIKKRTFNISMKVLSIFIDLGENVHLKEIDNIDCIELKEENDLTKYDFLYDHYPNIDKKMNFSERGVELFIKITDEINQKNKKEAEKVEKIFKPKIPYVTYLIMAICISLYLYTHVFTLETNYNFLNTYCIYGPAIRAGEYYRIITGTFLHLDIFHILFNMYALFILGSQAESFFGRLKFITIYFYSAIVGSLLSMLLNGTTASVGASGAIFGLLGAMFYFGYHYRVYLGNTLVKQILPVIGINLIIGFLVPGIDMFAHIGGLVGGVLVAIAVGLKHKSTKMDRLNGIIISTLYLGFLIFMNFVYLK